MSDDICEIDSDEAVTKLTKGLVSLYGPHLEHVKNQLFELNKKQAIICQELHEENLKLTEAQCDPELKSLFNKMKVYKDRLTFIRARMTLLYDKSTKLKKRVLKLEQTKQNEAKRRAQQREKEEQLIGKAPG